MITQTNYGCDDTALLLSDWALFVLGLSSNGLDTWIANQESGLKTDSFDYKINIIDQFFEYYKLEQSKVFGDCIEVPCAIDIPNTNIPLKEINVQWSNSPTLYFMYGTNVTENPYYKWETITIVDTPVLNNIAYVDSGNIIKHFFSAIGTYVYRYSVKDLWDRTIFFFVTFNVSL